MNLTIEILFMIVEYLDIVDISNLIRVSKYFEILRNEKRYKRLFFDRRVNIHYIRVDRNNFIDKNGFNKGKLNTYVSKYNPKRGDFN